MAPLTRKRKAEKKQKPEEAPAQTITSDKKRKLPVRAKDGESSDMSPEQPKATKVVFGDDDDMSVPVALSKPVVPAPKEEEEEEESDEDSDDEAPEAVSTSKVAYEIKKSKQAAQKAAQEQAAAEKRKRRERDDRFKQQAEERKKLEEQEKEKAEKEAAEQEGSDDEEEPAQSLIQRSRTQKAPNLLPAEFLTDSSSEDECEDDQEEERPRKRRVAAVEKELARQSRGPKDERVGSTVFRVAQKTDERMVPKTKRQTKNHMNDLLKRNRSAAKPRSGFFVK
ncbi:hypothetical protein FVEN_g4658 [Fusarium venenatum]|uniref:U3 snorna associated n=1 Tax=Fusarium venenatum TaxID=56646 RepID=A0A2L2SQ52_9HYPO|nr:uncharacterized protein FVRRES_11502 [Fusarium venenatum]KAG8357506.1 hypothetical protein FVEN_g4658 [Fusarium venenatum]KAH6978182.1 hypothetical protein EDB82DRAFT_526283 [Fusarium venenatum]CEI38811.1 unnamed protein product [Fusarium venenatum]